MCLGSSWLAEKNLMGSGYQAQSYVLALLISKTLPRSFIPEHCLKQGKQGTELGWNVKEAVIQSEETKRLLTSKLSTDQMSRLTQQLTIPQGTHGFNYILRCKSPGMSVSHSHWFQCVYQADLSLTRALRV